MSSPRKFRVWDGSKMREPPHKYFLDSEGTPRDHIRGWGYEKVDGEALLYTGLTDSEGTEIYEGDVVEFWEHDLSVLPDDDPEGHSRIAVVKYLDAHWWMDFTDPGKGFLSDISYKDHTARIIGNKYENPDLLKEPA